MHIRIIFVSILLFLYFVANTFAQDYSDRHKRVVHKNRLHIPTFFTKIDQEYFIVDCYNNRVIYTAKLSTPIRQWRTMDTQYLSWPHSIAYNGKFYVVDDTEAHQVVVYRRNGNSFSRVQTINNVGVRPHRTIYDSNSNAFYVLGSMSQTVTKIQEKDGILVVVYTKHLPFLNNFYVRSIRIIDGKMYFVSGPGFISVTEYSDDSYRVLKKHIVPNRYLSMNDIVKFNGAFYFTAFKKNLVKCESLDDFSSCKNLYDNFGMKGVPYYFSILDDDLYVTEIGDGNNVYLFDYANNNKINPVLIAPSAPKENNP